MTKQDFIANHIEEARSKCIGSRARAGFNAEKTAEKAETEWSRINSPEYIERQARIDRLVKIGGNLWGADRVYFNETPVGSVGRKFDFYVDVKNGSIHGCLTAEERAAAESRMI